MLSRASLARGRASSSSPFPRLPLSSGETLEALMVFKPMQCPAVTRGLLL